MGLEKRKGSRNLYRYGKKRCADGKIVSIYLGRQHLDESPETKGGESPAVETASVAQPSSPPCATDAGVSRHSLAVRFAHKKRHNLDGAWLVKSKTGCFDVDIDRDLFGVAQGGDGAGG